jgi:hypothetical protein
MNRLNQDHFTDAGVLDARSELGGWVGPESDPETTPEIIMPRNEPSG